MKKKKLLSLFLAFTMVLSIIPAATVTIGADEEWVCPTCEEEDCNGCLDIVLQARALYNDGEGWNDYDDGEILRIRKDDADKNYTLSVNIKPRAGYDGADKITDLKIAQKGTKMGDQNVNPGNAVSDVMGPFQDAAVNIKKILIGEEEVALLDHYMLPWFIARDDGAECLGEDCLSGDPWGCTPNNWYCPRDAHAGFASASLWNAWWKPHQLLQVGDDKKLQTELMDTANFANMIVSEELVLDSFTVEFSLCFDEDRCPQCNSCLKENCNDCEGCVCDKFCHECGCAQCFPAVLERDNGKCYECGCLKCYDKTNGKCGEPDCPNCSVQLGLLTTDSIEAGKPSIFDALEILKELVKMESNAKDNPAAIISTQGIEEDSPTIFCALEILKFLVGMDGVLLDLYGK